MYDDLCANAFPEVTTKTTRLTHPALRARLGARMVKGHLNVNMDAADSLYWALAEALGDRPEFFELRAKPDCILCSAIHF